MNLTMRPPLGAEQETHSLAGFLRNEYEARLRAYSAQPRDAVEHYETENDVLSGGYAYRQLFEFVQNAADAILEEGRGAGRIHVRLARGVLVAVNTGAPLDEDGIVALLNARSSSKRGGQIGRFGREDADIKRQRGRNWTRFSPLRGGVIASDFTDSESAGLAIAAQYSLADASDRREIGADHRRAVHHHGSGVSGSCAPGATGRAA